MKESRGQTLVATLVVLVIICILAAVYFVGSGGESSRPDGKGVTTVGGALAAAKDTECRSNLGQVRQSLQIQWTTDESYPPSIQDTRLGENYYRCPLGKEPYEYDSSSGKVKCKHPGHEKF